jgi:hypothetical protein
MTWREPRDPKQFVPVGCNQLRELADTYQPFVRFADAERFFPALAEAWLSHATSAPWPGSRRSPSAPPETGADPFRRGTAVCHADAEVSDVTVLGGTPNADDEPLQLIDEPDNPNSMTAYNGVDGSYFIDFGGWMPDGARPSQGDEGDLDYLFRAFSELAATINPSADWEPVELMAHLPQFWIPQPPSPTVYCEARWASDFSAVSASSGAGDFPPVPAPGPLDRFLVLTYHYLYPAREPTDGEPDVRSKEGQWEAVSLFFEAHHEGDSSTFHEPPVAVAISQGSDAGSPQPFASELRQWSDVHRDGTHAHPIVFSARGTHRFFFEPIDGQTWVAGSGGPAVPNGGSYDNNSEFPGWESILVGAVILGAILVAVGLWPVAVIVAVLAALLWLFSLIMDLCNDDSENPANNPPGNPEAAGDGPQAGDPDEAPAPGPGSSDGSVGAGNGGAGSSFGVSNSGSPAGDNTVSFDLRFVDRTTPRRSSDRRNRYTPFPSPVPCEQPTWWDYSGRWGVRVAPGLSTGWASGDQRVDELGRSWGYWHTLRFFEELLLAGP